MGVMFYILVLSFALAHCSNQVTLSCNNYDAIDRGLPGIPGKLGKIGEKGEVGETGRCDNQNKSTNEISKMSERVNSLDEKMNQLLQNLAGISSSITGASWEDCLTEGINTMSIDRRLIEVYCESDGEDRWLVFQKRYSGEVDFYLGWEAYKTGFGNLNGEFWLGLGNLHAITASGSYKLRVDLEDWDGTTKYAEYSTFSVGNSNSNYQLSVGRYSGTAGDSLIHHNGRQFSTKDRDNDQTNKNCAEYYHGAWWYKGCYESNLNGNYFNNGDYHGSHTGMTWISWRGSTRSMKKSTMKIQPTNPKQ